VLAIEIFQV